MWLMVTCSFSEQTHRQWWRCFQITTLPCIKSCSQFRGHCRYFWWVFRPFFPKTPRDIYSWPYLLSVKPCWQYSLQIIDPTCSATENFSSSARLKIECLPTAVFKSKFLVLPQIFISKFGLWVGHFSAWLSLDLNKCCTMHMKSRKFHPFPTSELPPTQYLKLGFGINGKGIPSKSQNMLLPRSVWIHGHWNIASKRPYRVRFLTHWSFDDNCISCIV